MSTSLSARVAIICGLGCVMHRHCKCLFPDMDSQYCDIPLIPSSYSSASCISTCIMLIMLQRNIPAAAAAVEEPPADGEKIAWYDAL